MELVEIVTIPASDLDLMNQILDVCEDQETEVVVRVLYNTLMLAVQEWEDCAPAEACEYIRAVAEQSRLLEMQEDNHVVQ